jgi:hypothetical protein
MAIFVTAAAKSAEKPPAAAQKPSSIGHTEAM